MPPQPPDRRLLTRHPACTRALFPPQGRWWERHQPRELAFVLQHLSVHPCTAGGLQGRACHALTALQAMPPCTHQRWQARPEDARTPAALSLRVALHGPSAERLLALLAWTSPAAILEADALGWELVHLAVCGGEADSAAGWLSLVRSPDTAPALVRLIGAAVAVHAQHTPTRRAEALRLLADLPREPWVAEARTALERTETPATLHRLLDPDVEARVVALQAWSARLTGNPLRSTQIRRLAARLHATPAGEQLCARLLALSSNREARRLLQQLGEGRTGRGGRDRVGVRQGEWSQLLHDVEPEWFSDDNHWYDYHCGLRPLDGREAVLTPMQQAVLACLESLPERESGWSAQLGARLDTAQRQALLTAVVSAPLDAARTLTQKLAHVAAEPEALLAVLCTHLQQPAEDDDALEALPELMAAMRRLHRHTEGRAFLTDLWAAAHPTWRPAVLAIAGLVQAPETALELLCRSPLAPRLALLEQAPVLTPAQDPQILQMGAGSLEQLPYPAFLLTVRGAVSIVDARQSRALDALCASLEAVRGALDGEAGALLEGLDAVAGEDFPILPAAEEALRQHVIAYVILREQVLTAPGVLPRSSHIRRFWSRAGELVPPPPQTWAALRAQCGSLRVVEGVAHALLQWSRQPPTWGEATPPVGKPVWTHLLRLVAMAYDLPPAPRADAEEQEPEEIARQQVDHLLRALDHAPLELAQALGMGHQQGLPRLPGGAPTPLEREIRQLLRESFRLEEGEGTAAESEAEVYTCRPISKRAALERGTLGGDCSSRSVPLRALSPHHIYYGLFQGETQQRGYMTVFEAFAVDAEGAQVPALVLETINVPGGALDTVQPDLLRIFEAIGLSRGLPGGLVVVMHVGTWNYQNMHLILASRRYRRGEEVRLQPAEPALWQAYEAISGELGVYCAFRSNNDFRRLAPFDPARDRIQPENAAVAEALLAQVPPPLEVLARDAAGQVAAFISAGWPAAAVRSAGKDDSEEGR